MRVWVEFGVIEALVSDGYAAEVLERGKAYLKGYRKEADTTDFIGAMARSRRVCGSGGILECW